MKNEVKLFEEQQIRRVWSDDVEDWYYSVVDVIGVLTDSQRARRYWNDLKKKLEEEGSQLSENIGQLKLLAEDGKMRKTDVVNTEQLLRLIQSIPSKKAEPFKLWLASVGNRELETNETVTNYNQLELSASDETASTKESYEK